MKLAQIFIICVACSLLIAGISLGEYGHSKRINSLTCYSCLGLEPKSIPFQEFWIVYPPGHEKAGQNVSHPDWVKAQLKAKIVFLFFWMHGCGPCTEQWDDMRNAGIVTGSEENGAVAAIYKNDISLFSLDAITPTGSNALDIYHPTGRNKGTPTTVIITLVKDNNTVRVGWYSFTGYRSGSPTMGSLRDILESAVLYHNQYKSQYPTHERSE